MIQFLRIKTGHSDAASGVENGVKFNEWCASHLAKMRRVKILWRPTNIAATDLAY
jgi:hypothetical protein